MPPNVSHPVTPSPRRVTTTPYTPGDPPPDALALARDKLAAQDRVIAQKVTEIARLRERLAKVEVAARLGFQLSTYAAEIRWSDEDTNTQEWLDGLEERIDAMQSAFTELGIQPAIAAAEKGGATDV